MRTIRGRSPENKEQPSTEATQSRKDKTLRYWKIGAVIAALAMAGAVILALPAPAAAAIPQRIAHTAAPVITTKVTNPYQWNESKQAMLTALQRHRHPDVRLDVLAWARRQRGCWYLYGGTACTPGFDCSGLVMEAWASQHVYLPRTTYEMLTSPLLVQVPPDKAVRGDLAFFGSGHVALVSYKDRWTLQAMHTGTRVQAVRSSPGFHPTAYYKVAWWKHHSSPLPGYSYPPRHNQATHTTPPAHSTLDGIPLGPYGMPPAAFFSCVEHIESGGDPTAYNTSSGASGLFGMELAYWYSIDSSGGIGPFGQAYPGGAYTAPASVQIRAFDVGYSEDGTSPWAPYDGC